MQTGAGARNFYAVRSSSHPVHYLRDEAINFTIMEGLGMSMGGIERQKVVNILMTTKRSPIRQYVYWNYKLYPLPAFYFTEVLQNDERVGGITGRCGAQSPRGLPKDSRSLENRRLARSISYSFGCLIGLHLIVVVELLTTFRHSVSPWACQDLWEHCALHAARCTLHGPIIPTSPHHFGAPPHKTKLLILRYVY